MHNDLLNNTYDVYTNRRVYISISNVVGSTDTATWERQGIWWVLDSGHPVSCQMHKVHRNAWDKTLHLFISKHYTVTWCITCAGLWTKHLAQRYLQQTTTDESHPYVKQCMPNINWARNRWQTNTQNVHKIYLLLTVLHLIKCRYAENKHQLNGTASISCLFTNLQKTLNSSSIDRYRYNQIQVPTNYWQIISCSALLSICQGTKLQNKIHGAGLFILATDMAGNRWTTAEWIVQVQLVTASPAAATTAYTDTDM